LKNYFSKGLLPPKYKTVLVCSSSGSSKKQTEITSPKETEQNRYPIMEGRFSQELGPQVPSSASSGFCPLTRTTPPGRCFAGAGYTKDIISTHCT
jgi:hypothetical protein